MIETKRNNIFGAVLTGVAPSANYRGESEGNHTPLQRLRFPDGHDYTIYSAEAIRNCLREMLRGDDFPSNRSRVYDSDQLAVRFKEENDPTAFADDKLFGFLNIKSKDADENAESPKGRGASKKQKPQKQGDSVLRVNYAVSITPYDDNDETMHQSPQIWMGDAKKALRDSAIIYRGVHVTAYEYPFGLNLNDLQTPPTFTGTNEQRTEIEANNRRWTAKLLRAISELNGVGGNHARAMFPFAPVSIILRFTARRTPDFDLYGYRLEQSELLEALEGDRLRGDEFYIGGNIVRENDKLKSLPLYKRANSNGGESPRPQSTEQTSQPTKQTELNKVRLFKTPLEAIEELIFDAGLGTTEKEKTE